MQIYLLLNGEQVGPYSLEQIQEMLASGAVALDTQAWHEALPEWTTVLQLTGTGEEEVVEIDPPTAADGGGGVVVLMIQHQATPSRLHCVLRILAVVYVGIPHGICLALRHLAGVVLWIVGFFAVLFTGKYPKGIHDFQVGNLRWGLRVMAYITMLSDRYPPFSGKE